MTKKHVVNNTTATMHCGPYTIYPGQGRFVESHYLGEKPTPKAQADNLSIADFVADFVKQKQDLEIEQLPGLSPEQFEAVFAHYQSNKPPQKLAPALVAEKTRRDSIALADTLRESVVGMSDEQLQAQLLDHAANEIVLVVLEQEKAARDRQAFLQSIAIDAKDFDDEELAESLIIYGEDADALSILQAELASRDTNA
ncbi:hypothetical protein NO559_07725 [Dasania sp. GY-MA-18]|uniref:Uncharacterized protein n=1 Tax=Dasania phycosphaerae TaxID=2950436 RepID=A0A9J6RM76_9GAMM|nr:MULTISPECIES: hypothetical protein [Dasania]MCR8922655.1 hypothetical protein [Dasania sp. GY-MA-18]MCZ0865085.1 hypothetical protein [Dasania phycosphaerae]MCZ0868811.1 hypothetical protein [Dasania phycosphaerae]